MEDQYVECCCCMEGIKKNECTIYGPNHVCYVCALEYEGKYCYVCNKRGLNYKQGSVEEVHFCQDCEGPYFNRFNELNRCSVCGKRGLKFKSFVRAFFESKFGNLYCTEYFCEPCFSSDAREVMR